MTAYSFKKRFVAPIQVGLGILPVTPRIIDDPEAPAGYRIGPEIRPKRQTIRADRRRHARPGEELQLYCGMRTTNCFLIGRARCTEVRTIVMTFSKPTVAIGGGDERYAVYSGDGLNDFAYLDGFSNWQEMREFLKAEHGDIDTFIGVLIEWVPCHSS